MSVVIETRDSRFDARNTSADNKSSPVALTGSIIGVIIHASISLILAIAAIVVLITYVRRHYARSTRVH